MALLEVRGLVKRYGRRTVVDGVSFEVNPGEVVGLLGPNGAGKTTSFRMATGQIVPNDGIVMFDNQDVTTLPMFRRARLGMGYLSQEQSIFRKLTVERNLIAILEALPSSRSLGRRLTSEERWARTEEALERFNLLPVRKNVAARCSGGEKRRLEIARCLVCEPMLILLDEPFAAVDPKTTEDIRKNIRDLADQGIGVLLTDHNVREVVKTADRIYLIVEGKVVCHGTPDQLIRDPIAIDAYLGTTFQDDVLMARLAGFAGFSEESMNESRAAARTTAATATHTRTQPPMAGFQEYDIPLTRAESATTQAPTAPAPAPAPQPKPQPVAPPQAVPNPVNPAPQRAPLLIDDSVPASANRKPLPPPVARPSSPPPPAGFSTVTQKLLEDEKMRRLIEQLKNRSELPNAWHELASRGQAAIPMLLEALERRELEIRHVAFKLLESITGQTHDYVSDAPEEVRLRQVAHLRARLERPS